MGAQAPHGLGLSVYAGSIPLAPPVSGTDPECLQPFHNPTCNLLHTLFTNLYRSRGSQRLPPYRRSCLKFHVAYPAKQGYERLVPLMGPDNLAGHLIGADCLGGDNQDDCLGLLDGVSHLSQVGRARHAVPFVIPGAVALGFQGFG